MALKYRAGAASNAFAAAIHPVRRHAIWETIVQWFYEFRNKVLKHKCILHPGLLNNHNY